MSGVNFLDKLLDGVAVKWTALGDERFVEVANAARRPVKASLRVSGKVPYYGANNIQDYVDGYTHDGEYVLIAEDGSASLANYSVQYVAGKFWANNHVHVVRAKQGLNARFLYHYLCAVDFIPYLPNKDRSKLTKGEMIKIPLPIPCPDKPQKSLEIQGEIARILDGLTELTTELTIELATELTARQKQYNYHREQLLNFENGEVNRLPLGHPAVGGFIRGGGFQKKDFAESGFGCIHYGQIYTHYGTFADSTKTFVSEKFFKKARKARPGDLIIATTSENDEDVCKAVAWLGGEEIAVSGDACIYRHNLNPKYVSYFFQTENFQRQKKLRITGSKVRRVNADDLAKLIIPIPSTEEQVRIVAILDKFEVLNSSVAKGLLREIDIRQKQCEYYRDLLLIFPRTEEVEA
ncbi:restriction endonuclease subunit S [Frateuria aurantia]|uniref:Restriction endonuclease S subunit n=1 Tax=Frateuria aurantia (strain ATCC 33424 / DSM 6220 / KCTC 2777 / LMG 1558 / NBRC 3245 / NCIMB 13370) TaxID=767434 RepID=H8L5D1_FRAAD|nr:restriction endonuclease subunit S [Frateuria aurantia]AFC85088.1 restriction endonuclease S subunit [Frateuria aurantia DSM 6220]